MKLARRGTQYPLRREASRYAKQTGSRDSRITSRYAMIFLIGLRGTSRKIEELSIDEEIKSSHRSSSIPPV
ncbi:hypothetical protein E3N88_43636 [Mikania micrantha]|uniref:Uncharacterized protein n=1 Tax=Mikania micrantha TaxID=192012 RepID=A0A5N6LEC9_9ASTR|nr:hypothetical protein E3N88_43636 [Mikania micrantha]